MAGESNRPNPSEKPKHAIVGEDVRSLAAGLAQKLREANIDCEILPVSPISTTAVRRDRVLVVLGLTFLTASAWAYLVWISVDMAMGGMDMAGYRMIPSGIGLMMPSDRPWQPIEFAFVFAMWVVMMAAMMTPSAAPMILVYARVGQFIETRTTPLATVCFGAGYFLVWAAFALLATTAQWALERATLLDSAMASTSNVLGALVFVAVGGYQWTRLKDRCLAQCQKPFAFLVRQGAFRPNAPGSLMLGLRHGALLLGADGATVRRRCDEHALDRWARVSRPSAASLLPLPVQSLSRPVHGHCRQRCLDGANSGNFRSYGFGVVRSATASTRSTMAPASPR